MLQEKIPNLFHRVRNKLRDRFNELGDPVSQRSTRVHSWFFSGIRVTRSLVLYVCFVDRCLSFCPFSFDHCVV